MAEAKVQLPLKSDSQANSLVIEVEAPASGSVALLLAKWQSYGVDCLFTVLLGKHPKIWLFPVVS